jgi:glycosyltransferase involved in cell wall biosynthesis
VTAWTILTHLLERGHDVSVCALQDPEHYDPTGAGLDARAEAVRELGAEVVPVLSRATDFFRTRPRGAADRFRRAWRPSDEELFPNLVDRDAMHAAVRSTGADIAFVYHYESLAASRGLALPRFAVVGDPPYLSALYRFREAMPSLRALRGVVRLQAMARRQPPLIVRLLEECDASGAFAAHHAKDLRRRGARSCEYMRTPVPDPGPVVRTPAAKPRLLLVGHLKGVVTLEGLTLFARHVLPRLERELGPDAFEVRIAGGYEPPPELRPLLERESVRFLGHVEDAAEEFRSAHVLLVPNSISLGIRVRVITGFSYGCCVVTHRANTLGIPELDDGRNALVGDTPEDLARAVVRVLADADLRGRLERGARETYERWFAPPVAAGRIEATLARIAPAASAAPTRP